MSYRDKEAPAAAVIAAMASSSVLSSLSAVGRQQLAASGGWLNLVPGEMLFRAGDPGDAVFIVVEGEIEVRNTTPGGRDIRLVAFGPGDLVGEIAALDGGSRSADVAAIRRSRLWRIPRAPLLAALEAEPKAAVALIVELSARLRATDAALEDKAVLDLAGRLARMLLAEGYGRTVALTQTEIARRLGLSREKVNRKLHAWADEGWVELSPAGIRILAASHLEAMIARRQQQ